MVNNWVGLVYTLRHWWNHFISLRKFYHSERFHKVFRNWKTCEVKIFEQILEKTEEPEQEFPDHAMHRPLYIFYWICVFVHLYVLHTLAEL